MYHNLRQALKQSPAPRICAIWMSFLPLALGASSDSASAVVAHGGIVYVAGSTSGALAPPNFGQDDVFVRAYDSSGNVLWTQQFGSPQEDEGLGVAADDGGVYVVGRTYGSLFGIQNAGQTDAFVAK